MNCIIVTTVLNGYFVKWETVKNPMDLVWDSFIHLDYKCTQRAVNFDVLTIKSRGM